MMTRRRNGAFAALVGTVLVATAVVSGWMLATSGSLAGAGDSLSSPRAALVDAPAAGLQEPGSVRITAGFQISQPRDPFRPLITEDSPVTGLPGIGGEPGDGPTNGDGFTPPTATITLQEIRDVDGVLRATVTVNGTTYEVGVGDTFAESYKVVSLTEDEGVFMFGDTAFTLKVGQQILK